MKRTLASETVQSIGQRVRIRGWYHNLRSLGKVNFLLIRDRSGIIQIVVDSKDELAKINELKRGTVLTVIGKVVASDATSLGVEVVEPAITVESPVVDTPPIKYYLPDIGADLDTILDYRSISVRNVKISAVFKIQAEIAHAYRLYMHDTVGAVEYFAPNIIGASSEGGAQFFNVDYFGYNATLAQSSQLYKQVMVGAYERVFALMPFFRAENSNTARHLTEGKQLEFEMGFFDSWHEIMDVEEGFIKYLMRHLEKNCAEEIKALDGEIITVPSDVPFPRLTFAEAQEVYFQRTGVDERHEDDLSPSAERELCAYALEKHGTECIFITDWKTKKRPFYSYPNDQNPELSNTFDLLCSRAEITSGGQRRHTYESMLEGLRLKEMDPGAFEDYLSIFKYGMPPHGGFGLGLERLTMTVLRLKNIRESSLYPSDPKRIAGTLLKARIFFGGENIKGEILRILKEAEVEYKHLSHEPTPTSEDSARVRSMSLNEGVKALILKGKTSKKNFQFNIPAHMKLDMKAAAEAVGEKCEFEDSLVIHNRFGLSVGAIPPFGNLLGLEVYFDQAIADLDRIGFNCGLTNESVIMRAKDLLALVEGKTGSFIKPA